MMRAARAIMDQAASRLQSLQRGRMKRRWMTAAKRQREAGAITIQAGQRGRVARLERRPHPIRSQLFAKTLCLHAHCY